MKKLFIILMTVVLMGSQAQAQMKPTKRYASVYEQPTYADMDMVKCGKGWASYPIKVKGGGKAPGVVTLTKAFNERWNIAVVSGILKAARNPKFTYAEDKEYGGETIVDRKNGYMCEDCGGADGDWMESCVWRRDNGHRLFAIRVGGSCDPDIEFVCFFDYDPDTETMTPEESPADTFSPDVMDYGYHLPRKGKDFVITEYLVGENKKIDNVYTFNGQKHVFAYQKTEAWE